MKNNINEISTPNIVKNLIFSNIFLLEFLKKNLINVSALSKYIFDDVKKINKKATIESISIAIKRLDLFESISKLKYLKKTLTYIQIISRTNLILYSFDKKCDFDFKKLKNDEIFFLNVGSNETTIILEKQNIRYLNQVENKKIENLCFYIFKGYE